MTKKVITNFGDKIAGRRARANGHSGLISVPAECISRSYERYIDRKTGIITLVPVEGNAQKQQEEEQ